MPSGEYERTRLPVPAKVEMVPLMNTVMVAVVSGFDGRPLRITEFVAVGVVAVALAVAVPVLSVG